MTKYGEVLDYRTANKAVVGKKYVFSNYLRDIHNDVEMLPVIRLQCVQENCTFPFMDDEHDVFQFCREVIEEEVFMFMTNIQLAEWCARGNGQVTNLPGNKNKVLSTYEIQDRAYEDYPVFPDILICPWDSDEWVKPTLDIYERDCKHSVPKVSRKPVGSLCREQSK